MSITPDEVVTLIFAASLAVGGVSALLSQTQFVKNRPGLEKLMLGVNMAAGRLKQAIPAGTTAAAAENMIAEEAVKVASNYAQSAKVSGATQTMIKGMIAGTLGDMLPPGHIVPSAPPVVQDAMNQLVTDLRTQLMAAGVPIAAAPATVQATPTPVVTTITPVT